MMSTPAQQAIENTHLHYVFIIACARTRDYADAKDPADNAARTLTERAGPLPTTSPLFPGMRQLRSIIHSAQQSLARQQQPQDSEKHLDLITTIQECLHSAQKSLARQQQPQNLEKGLDLITTIEECLTSKPK